MGLTAYLSVSSLLFVIGLACVLIRRHVIQVLMGVELIFNAAALNFVAFSHFTASKDPNLALSGQVISLFLIVLAAAEAAVALALVLSVFRVFGSVDIDRLSDLKG